LGEESQAMRIIFLILILPLAACAHREEWKSKTSLIVIHPAHTDLPEMFTLERAIISARFREALLLQHPEMRSAISKVDVRFQRSISTIEIVISADSRDRSLEAGRFYADAAIAASKEDPNSRIEVRILDAPAILPRT
jgi:hypothetical protein